MIPVRPDGNPVRKAVVPIAGLGTRFLPATRSLPKELLPVVDRPLIEFAVHEAANAGIDTIVLVNRPERTTTLDHFEPDHDLEAQLERDGRQDLLVALQGIRPPGVALTMAIQERALGLGHAVLCAREAIGDDAAFAVILPDDLVLTDGPGALSQLVDVHCATGASVIGVEQIDRTLSASYGMAAVQKGSDGHLEVQELVEKPDPADAPSDLGVVGRYVLNSAIFALLENTPSGAGGEIQLTDAIATMMQQQTVLAHALVGTRYDCGSRLGMLKATVDRALAIPELREELLAHLARAREVET